MISSRRILAGFVLCTLFSVAASSQSTTFTYQGKLADGGVAANGTYDLTFKLYDTLASGTQIGTDIVRDNVVVTDGEFTVDLDFGAAAFETGASRFLQLEVRPGSSTGTFTALVPRQPVKSSPYGIKAINATTADSLSASCVSCITDANIDTVNAGKVTGVLSFFQGGTGIGGPTFPPAGGFLRSNGSGWEISGITAAEIPNNLGSYIQNSTTTQASSNFNVSGTGTANIFSATTQFNIGGNRILGNAGNNNLFVGIGVGQSNTGSFNAFFGPTAGRDNTDGTYNSFFGNMAGAANTTGDNLAFFGAFAGSSNTDGIYNSFFGPGAGLNNTTGNTNSFFGLQAGKLNYDGDNNTIIGSSANVGAPSLDYATAIGSNAIVGSSDTIVLGKTAGSYNGTMRPADTVQIPGNLNVSGSLTGSFTVPTNNITGVLSQANGGTGVNSPGAAGNFLRSDGTNWTSSPFQASDIPVLSTSFIQNIPGIGTQSASFNIDGGGNANIFSATTQYNIGGNRVLAIGALPDANNLFVGLGAGQSNTGTENTFVGRDAGLTNNDSRSNSFFGAGAGQNHADGDFNSFFGTTSGPSNRGNDNAFFGRNAGFFNTVGSSNVFLGSFAGRDNVFGDNNVFVGYQAIPLSNSLTNATAIGARAVVSQSHSLVLGSIANVNGAIGDTKVGIGTSAPQQVLHANGTTEILSTGSGAGFKFRDRGSTSSADDWVWYSNGNIARFFRSGPGDLLAVKTNGNVGIGTNDPNAKLQVSGGNVYITQPNSLIITSPNGTCWLITVSNTGVLSPIGVPCP